MWDYKTPFPGAISQPIASNGILFLPAGNYLYAIGAEHYPQIVKGGTAYSKTAKSNVKKGDSKPQPAYNKNNPRKDRQKIKTRKMQIEVTNKNKREIPAAIDIKKRKNGKLIYSRRKYLSKSGKVEVPVGDNVEVTVSSKGYLPKKVIVNNKDKKKKIQLDKIEKGESYVIDNILFEFNKAYLKKESRDLLNGLLHIMQRDPSLKIEIRGHTDSVGNDNYNRKLSERRADAVAEYLIKNGISPERLNSVGFGESKPIADNKTKEGRKKNRRTEFYFPK